jgi:hypothetical protein
MFPFKFCVIYSIDCFITGGTTEKDVCVIIGKKVFQGYFTEIPASL